MKRLFICLLAICLMTGCSSKAQTPATIPSHQPVPSEAESAQANVALDYDTQFIRTEGGYELESPGVQIIHSKQELDDYYTTYHEVFDLERADTAYPDTIGFLDACDKYDAAFFEENYLIFVILEEGSGSVRHNVHRVERTHDGKIEIAVESVLPGGFGTADMAKWHVILELSRGAQVQTSDDVLIYWNGRLAYNGAVVEPLTDAAFKEPPPGILRSQEGDANLRLAGYSWFFQEQSQSLSVIADQSSRPAQKLKPVTISDKYIETIYAPILDSTSYAPTNSLGYFVKLNWNANPSSVTYTCWPDFVWEDPSTPQEDVDVFEDMAFYAKPGGYIYEITATWEDYGEGYHGTATYYVYIIGGGHDHQSAQQPQTVDDPITGYCGNTQTTLYIDGEAYPFMYSHSVTLTDLLVNLDYKPEKVCRCLPQYTVDTEFGSYGISLTDSYARCENGQADLTPEQIETIKEIIDWATKTSDISCLPETHKSASARGGFVRFRQYKSIIVPFLP